MFPLSIDSPLFVPSLMLVLTGTLMMAASLTFTTGTPLACAKPKAPPRT